jgi:uncharacterized membrane protein YeiB
MGFFEQLGFQVFLAGDLAMAIGVVAVVVSLIRRRDPKKVPDWAIYVAITGVVMTWVGTAVQMTAKAAS